MKKLLLLLAIAIPMFGCAQETIRYKRVSADTLKLSKVAVLPTHPDSGSKLVHYQSEVWKTDSLTHARMLHTRDTSLIAFLAQYNTFTDTIKVEGLVLPNGAQNGYVLKCNADGIASWQYAATAYQGTWNANTNTPTLANGTGAAGDFYIVYVGDTVNLGAGNVIFLTGGFAMYNGSIWESISPTMLVNSVNGEIGNVQLELLLSGDTLSITGGDSVVLGLAPKNATYITQTANATLTNEQALSSLTTGILKVTNGTGVLTTAIAGDFPTLNQNTTGSAAKLTTARAIYGNNFDGTAALTQVIASTYGGTGNGFTKFTGPATTERIFTLPNASATLLYSGGALGTPSSGTLTNCTFPTLNQNTTGTAAIATTVTVTAESVDPTCYPLFGTAATGNLGAKSQTNLKFDAFTGSLKSTMFNNLIITAPATSSTLTIANGKTLTVTGDATITGALGTGAYATIANYLPLAGGTMSGNLLFGDAVKASFGSPAPSDSEIWYDGGNNWLEIRGGTAIKLRQISGALTATVDATGIDIQTGDSYKVNGVATEPIYTLKVSLSNAQLKSLYDTPIKILDAPGSGRAIVVLPLNCYMRINHGTTSLTSTFISVYADGYTTWEENNQGAFPLSTVTATSIIYGYPNNAIGYSIAGEDTAIYITAITDITAGDGTVDLYINYRIITL